MQRVSYDLFVRVVKSVGVFCQRCVSSKNHHNVCPSKQSCPLYWITGLSESNQTDLTDGLKAEYMAMGVKAARVFFNGVPASWGDFVEFFHKTYRRPVHPNHTGQLSIMLARSGEFERLPGAINTARNKGSAAFMWRRLPDAHK